MKKVTLFSSLLVAGALTFTSVNDTAKADEIEYDGARTVWGTVTDAESDLNGDGWYDGGYSLDWLPQDQRDRVTQLTEERQAKEITQIEYNETLTKIFDEEHALINGPYPEIETTEENLASLAFNAPKTLNIMPIKDEPYNYDFVYDGYEFNYSYDGTSWVWGYDEVEELDELTDEELIDLVHNNPEVLNERPVKDGSYDFKLSDDNYVYHFISDGEKWKWSHEDK